MNSSVRSVYKLSFIVERFFPQFVILVCEPTGQFCYCSAGSRTPKFFCFCFFNKFIYLFIYGCVGSSFLCESFLQLRRAGATLHRGARASSLSRTLLLRSTGSRRASSVAVAHGPSCSVACGIFPDQGLNPCPLHWQADS